MNHTHLTQDERYEIAVLRKAGHLQGDIKARKYVLKTAASGQFMFNLLADHHQMMPTSESYKAR